MFGIKKSKNKENPIFRKLTEDIIYKMSDPDPDPNSNRSSHENLPLLPNGQRNSSIESWQLEQLPIHWRMRWQRLDLESIFTEEEELEVPIPPAKPPLLELGEDTKNKIKGMVLGEISQKEKEE